MMGDPKYVGIAEAIQGISGLITAVPIGYLSDRYGRSKIVHIGAACMLVNTLLTTILLFWIGDDTYEN